MNTTSDFINVFNSDNLASIIINFFDELMVLYNLIGDRHDLNINVDDNNASLITFILNMKNKDEAIKLYNTLNNSYFSVYNDKYNINMKLNKASIETVIVKAVL